MVFFLKVRDYLKKFEMIKKNEDFDKIIKLGKCLKGKYFNIYYNDGNKNYPLFGLAVSKKCGNAVLRNKIKRQLRAIIDNNKKLFKNCYNYIIMVRRGILDSSFKDMERNMIEIMERIK